MREVLLYNTNTKVAVLMLSEFKPRHNCGGRKCPVSGLPL